MKVEVRDITADSSLITDHTSLVFWLDRIIVAWLFVMVAMAPHSIAATQIAWMCGMLVWVVRFAVRPKFFRTPIDYALAAFLLFTIISSITSYVPVVSSGKLRQVSLFTIIYLVAENVRSRRLLRLLALTLVASCMVNVVFTISERVIGRGITFDGVTATSPLANAIFRAANGQTARGIQNGDTLLEVDGQKLTSIEQLIAALDRSNTSPNPAKVKIYRAEWMGVYEVARGTLLDGATSADRLGIQKWSHGRDWRASGFFGHYVTYAEALQLIASLAFGLLIAFPKRRSFAFGLLFACVVGLGLALLLTVTRASQLSFLISAGVITVAGIQNRRTVLLLAVCVLPLVLAAMFVLQQKRQVSFFDSRDGSTSWRTTVWREGFALFVSSPRHIIVGVGMDSIKSYGCQWGLFDNCRLPIGHMHSTPLQLALERGLPALIASLILVAVYGRMLWRLSRRNAAGGSIENGIALGALGGLIGFFASGLVHYNLGDSEVVMIFYIIMGLSLALERLSREMPSIDSVA